MRTSLFLPTLLVAVFSIGCTAPEQIAIDTFLGAVRDGQESVVDAMSLVRFPDSNVESWEVIEVGPESTEPYRLAELRNVVFEAKKVLEAKDEEDDDFLRANEQVAIRYQQKMLDDPEYRYPSGRMAEFQAEWDTHIEARKELEDKIKEAQDALEMERNLIKMSTRMGLKNTFEGDVSVKDVKVSVDGGSGAKTYTLTLRKYNLTDTTTGIAPTPSWIVTEIAD